jgi:3-mercaptopyruvate sulfurtransferase SseA
VGQGSHVVLYDASRDQWANMWAARVWWMPRAFGFDQAAVLNGGWHKQFAAVGALDRGRVITYCGGGIAASSDAFVLTLLGVTNVAVYDGSLLEWAADPSLPMETA